MINLVCVLDRSGSMSGTEKHVIDSFNEFIESQKQIEKQIQVSLYLFDNKYEEVFKDKPLHSVPKLTSDVYFTRGSTALDDAIGMTINAFKDRQHVFFFVETDGMENASTEYNAQQVKRMIEERQGSGWEFTFVGADLTKDQVNQMGTLRGFDITKTMSIDKSASGYSNRNTRLYSQMNAYAATIDDNDRNVSSVAESSDNSSPSSSCGSSSD